MKRAKMVIVYRCLLFAVTGLAIVPFVESSAVVETSVLNNCSDFRINKGPLITPCVSEIILQKGQNFTLTCKGDTKLLFKHQDLSEEVTSNFNITASNSLITEEEYSFQYTLDLYFVDQYAIGYYACSDNFVDENIVNTITEEAENTEHVSYIYLYVNGTDSLFAPMSEVIISRSSKILIECRPSTPDVEVKLSTKSQIKTPKYSPKIGFVLKKCDSNAYACQGFRGENHNETKRIRISSVSEPPKPQVQTAPEWFGEGDTFNLNCTVNITPNTIAKLEWTFPEGLYKNEVNFKEDKSPENITKGEIYNLLTIFNATSKYKGSYSCRAVDSCEPKESNKVKKFYAAQPFLDLQFTSVPGVVKQKFITLTAEFDSYPRANLTILKKAHKLPAIEIVKDNKLLDDPERHYFLEFESKRAQVLLTIRPLNTTDTAEYIFLANNGILNKSAKYNLLVAAKVKNYFPVSDQTCVEGMYTTFKCDVFGYPPPKISWKLSFYNNTDIVVDVTNSTAVSETNTSLYDKSAYLNILCNKEGNVTCIATPIDARRGLLEADSKMRKLLVYEMVKGFGISTNSDHGTKWFLENSQVSLRCLASKHEFSNVTWDIDVSKKSSETVELSSNEFSHVAELKIMSIKLNQAGDYTCVGVRNNESQEYDHIAINVLELQQPVIVDPEDTDEEVYRNDDKNLNCTVTGAPLPEIKWSKDGKDLLKNDSNVFILHNNLNQTAVTSTISIKKMTPNNMGKYECEAVGQTNTQKKSFTLKLKVEKVTSNLSKIILIVICLIILLLTILIVYLTLKVKKEKQFRKELAAAGLDHFKEGLVNSINPDLGIDEQAELLPYDERFEFPPEKLVYGKQLGAGAFGVVYRAEARGIINAEETTTVAVKMVKKTADNMYIKALASELKIMVHLGKHINIVNLLGACTKKVGKRELMVIVEYCMYGNIHNYMQRHREVFIDQLVTDNKEKLGKVNRAYSSTTGSTGMQSDYFGSTNTQDTDNTSLNTANTVRSGRKNIVSKQPMEEIKASESMQPEWRSNYESDYSYDGRSPRPLTSRDLLAWAFQIARGMEYLASRKVLHGDLAARNILLAEDNIVKICDFGLAKSIYKNEEYQHKESCLLPVKWLAIECMIDRLFSTQSDVWAFGIVLWELFSLAKTPYPNIHHLSLISFLSEGHRLSKPAYADDRLYSVMKKCWDIKPNLRPTFSELQEELGGLLEDNVRTHYVALNSSYMDKNAKVEGQEDYLAMMNTPDYNNLVTPSPDDRYVNTGAEKRFFPPTPVKVDDEGYLQISPTNQGIFSPRLPNSEFDFDPRKFNQKASEASSCGSELTPMLTLNNLPARSGSESDHEGNAPYLNVCPRIEEEADEVFAPSLNDTKNAKNSAVTNPTYITFDNIDGKPKDIINSYVNMNVPNGLVK